MRLNAPKKIVWIISVILAVIAVAGYFITIPFVTVNLFWIMLASYVLMLLGTTIKGF
ncbi:MAG: hypothetical protein JW737_00840 [Acidobacteria bacterium]|nr:hypothetical protein [Acidobacteriota bacterium]